MSLLVVGRDRAHCRMILPKFNSSQVISASAFFDKVRFLPFLLDHKLKLDNQAPLLTAQVVLSTQNKLPNFLAHNLASLYSSLFHGVTTPCEAVNYYEKNQLGAPEAISLCQSIDEELCKKNIVNKVKALYLALEIIKKQQIIPPSLSKISCVNLINLVDLTTLEIEIIKSLANVGLKFKIYLPSDFINKSINAPIEHTARLFEQDSNNKNIELVFEELCENNNLRALTQNIFSDNYTDISINNCEVITQENQFAEADVIAKKIAFIRTTHPTHSIALVSRSDHQRSNIYKESLINYNITLKSRKTTSVYESLAGSLLSILFSAKLSNLSKKDLAALLAHPLFIHKAKDSIIFGNYIDLIANLNINNINSYFEKFSDTNTQDLKNILENINTTLFLIKDSDTISNFIEIFINIIKDNFIDQEADQSKDLLLKSFKKLIYSKFTPINMISFIDFIDFIKNYLNKITMPHMDHDDELAIDFLALPEVLGKKFDHIFLVDMAASQLPQSLVKDPLFDDEQRFLLNKLAKKQVLKIFFDDPFDPLPVPPRQALEPFWFASLITSAQKSVTFSFAKLDYSFKEQAGSDFFLWLKKYVKITNQEYASDHNFSSLQERKIYEKACPKLKEAFMQRSKAFSTNQAGHYAFLINKSDIKKAFGKRFDIYEPKALTPTFIESFSQCAYAGFLKSILKIKHKDDKLDINNKIIGEIAHKTLDLFFSKNNTEKIVDKILFKVCEEFLKHNYVYDENLFLSHMEYLKVLLNNLITQLNSLNYNNNIAKEFALGLGKNKQKAIKLSAKNSDYFIGGIIDRLDKINDEYLIIDYKLSSLSNLKTLFSNKNIFNKHFQAPLYIRLVAENFRQKDLNTISFVFASIKDGLVLKHINKTTHSDIFERIFNDNQEDSLANSIDKIFFPIKNGQLLAQVNEQCKNCNFNFICRKPSV